MTRSSTAESSDLSSAIHDCSQAVSVVNRCCVQSADQNDAVTSDLLTEIAREVDKSLWLLESHLQG